MNVPTFSQLYPPQSSRYIIYMFTKIYSYIFLLQMYTTRCLSKLLHQYIEYKLANDIHIHEVYILTMSNIFEIAVGVLTIVVVVVVVVESFWTGSRYEPP